MQARVQCQPSPRPQRPLHTARPQRRSAAMQACPRPDAGVAATVLSLLLVAQPTHAAMELPNKESDDSSPMIQELKRKSEEKREERAKERLDNYYKRNYKDYFEFIGPVDRARGETGKAISQWLKDNQ